MNIALAIFMIIASQIVTAMFTPDRTQSRTPEGEGDIDFPQTEEGTAQAVIFGDCWSGDWTILALGNYRTTEVMSGSGGKK